MADVGPLSPEDVARRRFATVFRGFDTTEVRSFLARVAEQLAWARTAEAELRDQIANVPRIQPKPALQEDDLMAALGEETARVMRTAQQAAADIRAKAEENVTRILKEAHEEAERSRTQAETVLSQRTQEASVAAEGIRQSAVSQAEAIIADATWKAKEMLAEADAQRERVLDELARRTRDGRQQLELLQAGRKRLLESYAAVRRSLDEITTELRRADEEARIAGDQAAHRPDAQRVLGDRAGDRDDEAAALAPSIRLTPVPAPPEEAAPAEGGPSPEPVLAVLTPPEHIESVRILGPVSSDDTAPPRSAAPPPPVPPPDLAPIEPPMSIDVPLSVEVVEAEPPAAAGSPEPAADTVPAAAADAVLAVDTVPAADAAPADDQTPAPAAGVFARLRASAATEADVAAADDAAAIDAAAVDATEHDLQRRDTALDPLATSLARRVKRVLQDEQNEVLDRLRSTRGVPALAELLRDEAAHATHYRDAVAPSLAEAASAGAAAVGADTLAPAVEVVNSVAIDLAVQVVGALRRRVAKAIDQGLGDSEDASLADAVSAAYREWRAPQVERLVADHLAMAYCGGVFSGTAPGTLLQWVVDDADGDCPDCDDNALAGPTVRDEVFPTGQVRPPAHPGCRCLLVVVGP